MFQLRPKSVKFAKLKNQFVWEALTSDRCLAGGERVNTHTLLLFVKLKRHVWVKLFSCPKTSLEMQLGYVRSKKDTMVCYALRACQDLSEVIFIAALNAHRMNHTIQLLLLQLLL